MDTNTPSAGAAGADEEYRIFYFLRADVVVDRETLAGWAAQATQAVFAAAHLTEHWQRYDIDMQTKISCKVRNGHQLARVIAEATSASLPVGLAADDVGYPVIAAVGPARRSDLPTFLQRAQLLTALEGLTPLGRQDESSRYDVELGTESSMVWLLIRSDIVMPVGKMIAQVGHAIISTEMAAGNGSVAARKRDGGRVVAREIDSLLRIDAAVAAAGDGGIFSCWVVDAGRTIFSEPTRTVAAIGPCTARELPRAARALFLGTGDEDTDTESSG